MDTAIPVSPAAASEKQDAAIPRLELHVPAHHPAPGERPDFSYVPRFPAGSVERPEIDAPARETHPLADKLIRVLEDGASAVGGWNPNLPPETLRRGLRAMM